MKNLFGKLLLITVLSSFLWACGDKTTKTANADNTPEAKTVAKETAKKTETKKGLAVGDIAPDFSLKNVDGKMVSLESLGDVNGYIVIFTCNHCPYAVMYEDRLIALHETYAAKGYPVVAINPNDPAVMPEDGFEEMKVRADEKKFPFVYLFDGAQKLYPQYGATRTPHVYLLDKERKVQYIGAIDDSPKDESAVEEKYLEKAITALSKGEKPDPNFTKAIGCSIKKKA